MSSRYLAFADILGRICICLYFMPAMIRKVAYFRDTFARDDLASVDFVMVLASLSSLLFLAMMCAVTITRLPPVRTTDHLEGYVTALAGTFIVGALVGYLPQEDVSTTTRMIGLALTIIGLLASVCVLAFLGRAFSIMPDARTLVTRGPYSIVRHPLYLTEEIAVIGFIMLNLSVWSVSLGIIQWLLQLRRMVNEERVLRGAFPEYDAYAAVVPRILPLPRTARVA
ncbi:methyltransferase family protein [Ensifer sp. R-19]|uniref:methyltransferase family protein n=1 Tax=Ensifer sp. R-19 TaxID=3404055 RepID=UPI003CEA8602